jgi:hypothetical protein
MPQVPQYQPQIQANAPQVNIPKAEPIPDEAFGGQVAQAVEVAGSQIEKAGSELFTHLVYQQHLASKENVAGMMNKYDENIRKFEYDTTPTELDSESTDPSAPKVQTVSGILNRKGNQATGITTAYTDYQKKLMDEMLEATADPFERYSLQKSIEAHHQTELESVSKHEAQQNQVALKATVDQNIKVVEDQAYKAVSMNDLDMLATSNYDQIVPLQTAATGKSPVVVKQELYDNMAKNAVEAKIDDDPMAANRLLNDLIQNGRISNGLAVQLQKTVRGKEIDTKASILWESPQIQKHQRADGSYDTEGMKGELDALGITPGEKEVIFSKISGLAGERERNVKAARANNEREMMNQVQDIYTKGGTLDSALPLASKYGYDPVSIAENTQKIHKIFAPNVTTDVTTYLAIKDGLNDGSITDTNAIEQAKGKLSTQDYIELHELQKTRASQKQLPQDALVWDTVKKMVEAKVGTKTKTNGVKTSDAMIYAIQQAASQQKLSGQALIGLTDEMLKSVPGKTWTIINPQPIGVIPKFQFDVTVPGSHIQGNEFIKKNEVAEKVLGSIALGNGNDVAQKYEGDIRMLVGSAPDNASFGQGTKLYNAIQTLVSQGKRLTKANIEAILPHVEGK